MCVCNQATINRNRGWGRGSLGGGINRPIMSISPWSWSQAPHPLLVPTHTFLVFYSPGVPPPPPPPRRPPSPSRLSFHQLYLRPHVGFVAIIDRKIRAFRSIASLAEPFLALPRPLCLSGVTALPSMPCGPGTATDGSCRGGVVVRSFLPPSFCFCVRFSVALVYRWFRLHHHCLFVCLIVFVLSSSSGDAMLLLYYSILYYKSNNQLKLFVLR